MTNTLSSLRPLHLTLACVGLVVGAASMSGCRGEREDAPPRQFFPDMDDSPKWEPQGESQFFADGRMMRLPPTGTVAFGRQGFTSEEPWATKFEKSRDDLVQDDAAFYQGKASDGTYLAKAPIVLTKEDLLRGQERFNIYCATCHNYNGDGQGTVGVMWSYPVPNFHDDVYTDPKNEKSRDGYLFHIARDGVWSPDRAQNKMPGYAHAIGYDDAWRIVAYIRVLQSTRRGTLQDVPADKRDEMKKLMEQKGQASAAAAAPVATPAPTPATTGGSK